MNYSYFVCAIVLAMYCTPCIAADAASQQSKHPELPCISTTNPLHGVAATAEDIVAILSNYTPEQDPTKPHYLTHAQVDALNAALNNFFGLKLPGLLETSQR